MIEAIRVENAMIADLDLDFTLPGGGASFELRKGGRDTPVTMANVDAYVRLVAHWLLTEGVARQMEAVREGFESIVPLAPLRMFYAEEVSCAEVFQWMAKAIETDLIY